MPYEMLRALRNPLAATMPVLADDVPDYIAASHRQSIARGLNDHRLIAWPAGRLPVARHPSSSFGQGDGGAFGPQPSYTRSRKSATFDGDGVEDLAVVASGTLTGPILVVARWARRVAATREVVDYLRTVRVRLFDGLFVQTPESRARD